MPEKEKDIYFKKNIMDGEVSFALDKYIPFDKPFKDEKYKSIKEKMKSCIEQICYTTSENKRLYAKFEGDPKNSDIDNILLYNIGINCEFSCLVLELDKKGGAYYFYSNKIDDFIIWKDKIKISQPICVKFSYSLSKEDSCVAKIWYKARESFIKSFENGSNQLPKQFSDININDYSIIMELEINGVESLPYSGSENTPTIKSLIDATLTALCYNKDENIDENLLKELDKIIKVNDDIKFLLTNDVGILYNKPLFTKKNNLQSNPPDNRLKGVKVSCSKGSSNNNFGVDVSIYLLSSSQNSDKSKENVESDKMEKDLNSIADKFNIILKILKSFLMNLKRIILPGTLILIVQVISFINLTVRF